MRSLNSTKVVSIDQVNIYYQLDRDAIPGECYLKIRERASEFDCTYRRRMTSGSVHHTRPLEYCKILTCGFIDAE